MDRLPLADELPYEFLEPKITPFWHWVGRMYSRHQILHREQRVMAIETEGLDKLTSLFATGDGIMIAPNHSDNADASVMLELSGRVKKPFTYMAAYQIFRGFAGVARFMLPRVGAFPVDREGSDLRACKLGVDILATGKYPLVLFPEGEIYHVCDQLTPIREGAASLATMAAKRAAAREKTIWIVPMALKYRFLEGVDPLPSIHETMDRLESRFTWWPKSNYSLVQRIYAFAEGMLGLKEIEYLGATQPGSIKARIGSLREAILGYLEDRHNAGRRTDPVPVRAKELRRICLEKLADETTSVESAMQLRRDLHDVFVAVQLFSYPGDYLQVSPSIERIAETLTKFEQDMLSIEPPPYGPRRVILKVGEPINVRERIAAHAKPRLAAAAITTELESSIQAMLDTIGPGRPYHETSASATEPIGPRLMPKPMSPLPCD